jgi:hypothetical protein
VSLASWMRDAVTVASQAGANESGDPTYGPQRTLKARVVYGASVGKTENPPEVVVYCEQELLVTDRIWLPGADPADANAASRPAKVGRARAMTGARSLWKASL